MLDEPTDVNDVPQVRRIAMSRQVKAGTPWRAEPSLDVIAMLDQPAWAALAALIAECPVIHDALTASLKRGAKSIDAHAFTFVADNADIARVRDFMGALPDLLGGRLRSRRRSIRLSAELIGPDFTASVLCGRMSIRAFLVRRVK